MQKPPIIKTNYSLEFEELRVKTTFEKISWFREHGYNPLFPGNKGISDIDEKQGVTELIKLIKIEYDSHSYEVAAQALNMQWQWFAEHWAESPLKDTTLVFQDTYEVFLTSYGVRGSYDLPNTIVMNVRQRENDRLAIVLFHEIIHLAIEPLIQKYEIPHWYKERLVDLFYKRIFPEKAFEQNLKKEVLAVDPIFNEYFSNVETMIEKLSLHLKAL